MCIYTYIYVHNTSTQHHAMGWLRSVGSIKLHVSFAEYRLFHRALLQKRPIIVSILLTEATPCNVRIILQVSRFEVSLVDL